jgi:nitrogen PTS system EIIA component
MQLSVREAAGLLRVSEKTVYRWIERGELAAHKVNEQYRLNRAELLEWATARQIAVPADLFREPEQGPAPSAGLAVALCAGGVHRQLAGADKFGVLGSMVAVMPLPEEVDRQFLLQLLLARESLGSTGMGRGIAVPHVRNPIVMHVRQPIVTLGFLSQPVDFAAVDGLPVHTLFAIVTPTIKAHLHLLSRLAFALQQPEFSAAIAGRSRDEAIFAAAEAIDRSMSAAADGAHG